MSAETRPPFDERPLRVERILEILPPVPELRPLQELLISASRPDPERRWTDSGALGTVGERLVDAEGVRREASQVADAEARRLAEHLRRAGEIVEAVAAGRSEDAVALALEQGGAEEEAGRAAGARGWYRSARLLARAAESPRTAEALRKEARAARADGDLEGAARRYEDAYHEATGRERARDRVVAAMGRGNVAVDRGRWDEAGAWYRRVMDEIGTGGAPRRERWQALQNLAIVHRRRGELAEARSALEAARAEAAPLDDPDADVEVENGWGQLLLAEGDARAAELHFRRALEAASAPKARVTVGVNLGEALLAAGRMLDAAEAAREAEAAAVAGRVTGKLPEVYRLLARVAQRRGEPEAFVLLTRALELIREHGLPAFEEALTLEALGELRATDDPEAARGALERAARLYAGLGMEERSRTARERAGRTTGTDEDQAGGADEGPPRSEDRGENP